MVWGATEEESDLACLMKTMQISDYSRLFKLSGFIVSQSVHIYNVNQMFIAQNMYYCINIDKRSKSGVRVHEFTRIKTHLDNVLNLYTIRNPKVWRQYALRHV